MKLPPSTAISRPHHSSRPSRPRARGRRSARHTDGRQGCGRAPPCAPEDRGRAPRCNPRRPPRPGTRRRGRPGVWLRRRRPRCRRTGTPRRAASVDHSAMPCFVMMPLMKVSSPVAPGVARSWSTIRASAWKVALLSGPPPNVIPPPTVSGRESGRSTGRPSSWAWIRTATGKQLYRSTMSADATSIPDSSDNRAPPTRAAGARWRTARGGRSAPCRSIRPPRAGRRDGRWARRRGRPPRWSTARTRPPDRRSTASSAISCTAPRASGWPRTELRGTLASPRPVSTRRDSAPRRG